MRLVSSSLDGKGVWLGKKISLFFVESPDFFHAYGSPDFPLPGVSRSVIIFLDSLLPLSQNNAKHLWILHYDNYVFLWICCHSCYSLEKPRSYLIYPLLWTKFAMAIEQAKLHCSRRGCVGARGFSIQSLLHRKLSKTGEEHLASLFSQETRNWCLYILRKLNFWLFFSRPST